MPQVEKERPRERIQRECLRRGKEALVLDCVHLLTGGEVDEALVVVLGGAHARALLATGVREPDEYWLRVWAARGLMWAWDDVATDAICAALNDEAWRVREMACKVVGRNNVGDALPTVAHLMSDASPRVQTAARRAVERLTALGA